VQALGSLSMVDLREEYAACGLFASAALYEPFGLAALEAAHAGTALVLSDIPTHRELWDGAAVFVPPRDAEGFAACCAALLDNPDEAARLGALARQRAMTYSRASMVAATEALNLSLAQVGT
jgi:glycosyltransferase involved in cell wall biosynthesis